MDRHSCRDCAWRKIKMKYNRKVNAWRTTHVCTLFDDNPEVNIEIMTFCEMWRKQK